MEKGGGLVAVSREQQRFGAGNSEGILELEGIPQGSVS
jgi:hypothetical protein